MSLCLASSVLALDNGKWEIEEHIDLGEFPLGKADLTGKMGHEIIRLNTLPDGRFVRIYVRTNKVGSIKKNKELAEERGQAVIGVLRGVVSFEKLPDSNLEVANSRYDKDGVDAQGAWIEIYKPRLESTVLTTPETISTETEGVNNNPVRRKPGLIALLAITVCFTIGGLAQILFRNRLQNVPTIKGEKIETSEQVAMCMSHKSGSKDDVQKDAVVELPPVVAPVVFQTKQERLNSITRANKKFCLDKTGSADVVATFNVEGIKFYVYGKMNLDGNYPTFFQGPDGLFVADKKRRWRASVESSVRQCLAEKNSVENPQNFEKLNLAIKEKNILIIV